LERSILSGHALSDLQEAGSIQTTRCTWPHDAPMQSGIKVIA